MIDDQGRDTVLGEQELALLTRMADGRRRGEIAGDLDLSVRALREVRRGLLAKLGARTDQHAAAIAFRRGLLPLNRRGDGEDSS